MKTYHVAIDAIITIRNLLFVLETPLASFWITHWVCLILLMILCCGNSLLVRGVYIDGEEEGGQCVVFQVNYLRYHYKVSVSTKTS
jgi:hypothetical protein